MAFSERALRMHVREVMRGKRVEGAAKWLFGCRWHEVPFVTTVNRGTLCIIRKPIYDFARYVEQGMRTTLCERNWDDDMQFQIYRAVCWPCYIQAKALLAEAMLANPGKRV